MQSRYDSVEPLVRTGVWLASHVLPRAPQHDLTDEKRRAFESRYRSWEREGAREIEYDLPYPKREFLAYVAAEKPVVLHGSKPGIETFEPREQTNWRGEDATAVFATTDVLLAIFFAVLDRTAYAGSLRDGGFLVETPTGTVERRQYFSVALEPGEPVPFTTGAVYLLPRAEFEPAEYAYVGFDEWYATRPIEPLGIIAVEPDDFPTERYLARHEEGEPTWKSALLYRWRRRRDGRPAPLIVSALAKYRW